MPYSPKKRAYQRREKKIQAWGGVPEFLPIGVEPTDEQLLQRKLYFQSILPEELRESYVSVPKSGSTKKKYLRATKRKTRTRDGSRTKEKVESDLYASCKSRAKRKELPFDLDREDIVLPDVCPVLGIPFRWNGKVTDGSPTLDRIVPELGYVKGNIAIISHKANRIKTNASAEEIGKVYSWLRMQGVV